MKHAFAEFAARYRRNKGAVAGLVFAAVFLFFAALGPVLWTADPWEMVARPFLPPMQGEFLFGTDALGRAITVGLVHGARASLIIGVVSTLVAVLVGIALGGIAGFFGGVVDDIVMSVTEFFQAIPSFILAVLLVAISRPSFQTIVITIAIVTWPPVARLVRGEFLTLRSRQFVEAARVLGQSNLHIIFREILPNCLPPIIVMSSLMVATAILFESALSFLGLGDPNLMTWGYMIGAGRSVIRMAWWASVFPGLAIAFTVLAINLVGEGVNDALNPRLARKGR